ncbi:MULTISPECIES: hypothetical protein [unclassified Burkholderia]|uniref:hypothetical protein n=1 Tax=unclassified Burkholderia TaxID=2613784 RepID=UPI000F570F21|nr:MULTISPECIES: hypothetical protein [unclassified Burkholderia]RQR90950.1 hypothetical protein DIE04_27150 [Burkholderia sp. Bp8994]RQS29144.1 hypothetical protein DIE05_14245 [Burkholderia sp. Bp8995]RQS38494.1 hypothetical protein DIE01_19330 [Burkholderia sp. Bp8990]RQS39652.1 hypothetical protein DIE00_33090 [Burkholderia sp. Bp8989]
MSRSKRKNPIGGITTAESEAQDKEQWHRRHRRVESARLKKDAVDYEPESHRTQSDQWKMDKDGKAYWGKDAPDHMMRK